MTTTVNKILGVVFALAALSACNSAGAGGNGAGSGSGGVGGGGFSCNPTDFLVIGGTTVTEATSSAYPPNCDPQVLANHFDTLPAGTDPGFNILVQTGFNGSSFSELKLNMNIYGETTGTYTHGGAAPSFGAIIDTVVATSPSGCAVQGGTVTLTKVESAGGKVEGTFNFTSTLSLSTGGSCGSFSGSFSAIRNDL